MWKNRRKAALTFSFDDGYKETSLLTLKLLHQFNLKATYNIIANYVGSFFDDIPTAVWYDWVKARNYGMEIASHSSNHIGFTFSILNMLFRQLPDISENHPFPRSTLRYLLDKARNMTQIRKSEVDISEELMHSKKVIEQYIPTQRVHTFVYPGGAYDRRLKEQVRLAGYTSARSLINGYNELSSIDFYALKSKLWTTATRVDEANEWVDEALNRGAWLIETLHLVTKHNRYKYKFFTKIDDFARHLCYATSRDIWIDTQENIVKYLKTGEYYFASKVLV